MMMAAEVSRQLKSSTPTTSNDGKRGHGGGPITRDFLGGDFGIESKELDLDLHVPAGWEKRLDLKSGNVYIQRCNPIISLKKTTTTSTRTPLNSSNLQDLNFPPHTKPSGNSYSTGSTTLSLFEDTTLDLKLIPNSSSLTTTTTHNSPIGGTSSPMMISNYQSVCTLDKVKSALDRAWRDPPSQPPAAKKRSSPSSLSGSSSMNQHYRAGSSSPSSMAVDGGGSSSHNNNTNTNNNIHHQHLQLESSSSYNNSSSSSSTTTGLMVAAACPSCLLYVLVSKNNPRCPKCSSIITLPVMPKKPKIDLNISI